MVDSSPGTEQLQGWLERMRSGDRSALDELIRHVCSRLEKLTRQLLRSYPGVHRWAQTDDVLQNALLRLLRALKVVQPESMRDFFALATVQIRRELLDLARHYYGPEGMGANHASQADAEPSGTPLYEKADQSLEPSNLAEWCEFHRHIDELPGEEREVIDLLFYQGLTQAEAAIILNVTVRTVQRRWQSALLKLHRLLKGNNHGDRCGMQ